jgi:hypothetical protein
VLARFTPLVRLRAFTRSSWSRRTVRPASMKYLPTISPKVEMGVQCWRSRVGILLLFTETQFHEFSAAAVQETVH